MKGYRTKRIALPGGRVIEIVYFSEPADDGGAAVEEETATAVVADVFEPGALARTPDAEPALELHVCPGCASELVYPTSWEERGGDAWRIERRCPNCEWRHAGEFSQEDVELFDDALNEGTEALLVQLRGLARANMEADVARLIEGIQGGLIEPMDF